MNVAKIDWSCPEERRRWEEQNGETLRKWAALSLTEKIKIIEEMEKVARTFHDGKLPQSPDEPRERTTFQKLQ
jgi:hypothetical protein